MTPIEKFVSIVVPVRNEEDGIQECITSLMNQDYPKDRYEIIVVDGHSRDSTLKLLSKFPIKVIEDDGRGVSDARNKGTEQAKGDIIAFTDGDCTATPGWIRSLSEKFDDPNVAGVGGGLRAKKLGSLLTRCEGLNTQATYRGFLGANIAYRRSVLNEVGGFDPNIRCGEDSDLYLRVIDRGCEVPFEGSAVVIHAPPDNGSWLSYFRKEFWYARMDARVFFPNRIFLILRDAFHQEHPLRARAKPTWHIMRQTVIHLSIASLLLASILSPYILYAGLAMLTIWTAHRTLVVLPILSGEGLGGKLLIILAFTSYISLKAVVRGFGTLVGGVEAGLAAFRGWR